MAKPDADLVDLTHYYAVRLDACRSRPALHRHQIAAYEALLSRARAAPDVQAFHAGVMRAGQEASVMRAEWLDRYANGQRIHAALGDARKRRAAQICYRAGLGPGGAVDFVARIGAAKARATPLVATADEAAGALLRLILAIAAWTRAATEELAQERRADIAAFWAVLQRCESGRSWPQLLARGPHRDRLPFDDAGLAWLEARLREVVGDASGSEAGGSEASDADREDADAGDRAENAVAEDNQAAAPIAIPTAADVAAGFHATCAALPDDPALDGVRAAYTRVFALEAEAATGPAFLRAMAENDLYTQLAREPRLATARAGLARVADRSQPHATHHFTALIRALEAARTPTEIEYEVERLEEMFAVESAWHEIALAYATAPITAAVAYQERRDAPHARAVARAVALVRHALGADWEAALRSPRVWDFFARAVFTRPADLTAAPADGGHLGEVGLPARETGRDAAIWKALRHAEAAGPDADPTDAGFADADALAAHLGALVADACAAVVDTAGDAAPDDAAGTTATRTDGSAGARHLVIWGAPVPLDALLDTAAAPPRPEVPTEIPTDVPTEIPADDEPSDGR